MLNQSDLNDLKMASGAREAIFQARSRVSGEVASSVPASGPRYAFQNEGKKLPVYDNAGNLFVSNILPKNKAVSVPTGAQAGSILEYKDGLTGDYHYGKVVSRDGDKIEVKKITQEEVDNDQNNDNRAKIYKISDDDVKDFKSSGLMKSLMALLDPSENLVFKLFTLLLVGDMFESDSLTDIFMAVYLRILGLAVILIVGLYISTTFF